MYQMGGSGAEVTGVNNVLAFICIIGMGCTAIHMSGRDQVKERFQKLSCQHTRYIQMCILVVQ